MDQSEIKRFALKFETHGDFEAILEEMVGEVIHSDQLDEPIRYSIYTILPKDMDTVIRDLLSLMKELGEDVTIFGIQHKEYIIIYVSHENQE